MELAQGQVWLDQEGGSREITYLRGSALKFRYRHPGSALVKELSLSVSAFLERITEFKYTLKGPDPVDPAWQDWPDQAPQLSWDDWEEEVAEDDGWGDWA